MSPPPPSLEALVERGGPRREKSAPRAAARSLWFLAVAVVATGALAAYLMR